MSWVLYMTDDKGAWISVAPCESLSAAARRIIQIEALPVHGLFFEFHVSADHGSDEEALGHLEYEGKRACYAVKRVQH